MAYDPRRQIDMTPDGRFTTPPGAPIAPRIIAGAVLLAIVAGSLAMAALALWAAFILIPIAFAAVLVGVLTIRFKVWQARRRAASFGSDRYVARRP